MITTSDNTTGKRSVHILLIEDDDGHAALISRALESQIGISQITRMSEGGAALNFLENYYSDSYDNQGNLVVLLDLNMPGMNGFETLQRIRSTLSFANTPVFVLTTSDDENEITRCYEKGANLFFTKEADFIEFNKTLESVGSAICEARYPARKALTATH